MSILKGTNVASTIVPFTTEDLYATHDSLYGKGGYKEVATEQERDAIPETRLKEGTKVYVQSTKQEYRWVNNKWEQIIYASDGTGTPISSLDDIQDVDILSVTANQVLMYDGDKWTNKTIETSDGNTVVPIINNLDDISDVNISNIKSDQFLKWDGSKWVNSDVSGISADIKLDDNVTQYSNNAVKSSGIFNAINNTVNDKFVVLTEDEYNSIIHDAKTFYFIKS